MSGAPRGSPEFKSSAITVAPELLCAFLFATIYFVKRGKYKWHSGLPQNSGNGV